MSSGTVGCLSSINTISAESTQLKAITVEWQYDGHSYRDQVVQLLSDGESEITGRVATEYNRAVSSPSEITVSKELHDQLELDFGNIWYSVGFCGGEFDTSDGDFGCRNEDASRADFDSVQFGDQAEVTISGDQFHVHQVSSGDIQDWDTDIREYEWSDLRSEHGR